MSRKSNKKLANTVHTFMMDLPETMTDTELSTTVCCIIDAYVGDSARRRELLIFSADAMDKADEDGDIGRVNNSFEHLSEIDDIDALADMANAMNDADAFLAKSAAGWKK